MYVAVDSRSCAYNFHRLWVCIEGNVMVLLAIIINDIWNITVTQIKKRGRRQVYNPSSFLLLSYFLSLYTVELAFEKMTKNPTHTDVCRCGILEPRQ